MNKGFIHIAVVGDPSHGKDLEFSRKIAFLYRMKIIQEQEENNNG